MSYLILVSVEPLTMDPLNKELPIPKISTSRVFFRGGRGGGGGHPPPLRILCPPLEIPKKICFRVNVLAFSSYLLQIPIRVIITCQINFQIALDAISEHLKFKIFWGGRPPRLPQTPVFEVHRILHIKFILPPLGEFSKKNTDFP